MRIRSTFLAMLLLLLPAIARSQPSHDPKSQHGAGKINVAVLLYDGALMLDYGVAAEMFLAADFMRAFNVYTIAPKTEATVSIAGKVAPDYTLADAPAPQIVIVPGGPTWSQAAEDPAIVSYLKRAQESGAVLYSICTGGLLLAKAGFLEKRRATTNHQAIPMLRKASPSTTVDENAEFVDDGNVVTAAGAGTAIDATLHVIERFSTPAVAKDLGRRYLDYPYIKD